MDTPTKAFVSIDRVAADTHLSCDIFNRDAVAFSSSFQLQYLLSLCHAGSVVTSVGIVNRGNIYPSRREEDGNGPRRQKRQPTRAAGANSAPPEHSQIATPAHSPTCLSRNPGVMSF